MSDKETDANQDATHIATDDELSQVADEAMAEDVVEEVVETEEEVETDDTETEVVEEEAEEEVEVAVEEELEVDAEEDPEEPESPAERSKLGRKVKKLETLLESALAQLKTNATSKPAAVEEQEDELDPGDYIRREDVPKILAAERAKETEEKSAYRNAYLTKVLEIGKTDEVDDGLQDEIWEELESKYNKIETGTPETDATINFYKAQAAVMARKVNPAKENPLKGGKPKGAIGVGGGADNKVKKAVKAVKLDAEAASFAADLGLSNEKVAEILGKKDKPHLGFHRG